MYLWKQKASIWLVDFLVVQLFITLISWPILLWWGLSITPLSLIGNLLFGPFLTGFLLLSSLIVSCELVGIPNDIFLFGLEKLTTAWIWLIACNSYDLAVTFAKPSLLFALTAPLLGFFIIHFRPFNTNKQKLSGLCAAYCILIVTFSLRSSPNKLKIPYGKNYITVTRNKNNLTMTDPGFSRRYKSIDSWVNYTLLPELAKHFGTQNVNKLILQKKTPSALVCAEKLHKKGITRELCINSPKIKPITINEPSTTKPFSRVAALSR